MPARVEAPEHGGFGQQSRERDVERKGQKISRAVVQEDLERRGRADHDVGPRVTVHVDEQDVPNVEKAGGPADESSRAVADERRQTVEAERINVGLSVSVQIGEGEALGNGDLRRGRRSIGSVTVPEQHTNAEVSGDEEIRPPVTVEIAGAHGGDRIGEVRPSSCRKYAHGQTEANLDADEVVRMRSARPSPLRPRPSSS